MTTSDLKQEAIKAIRERFKYNGIHELIALQGLDAIWHLIDAEIRNIYLERLG